MNNEKQEQKLSALVKENTQILTDLSIVAAGIRGILFSPRKETCDPIAPKDPSTFSLEDELSYQRELIKEINADLGFVERRL